MDIPSKHVYDVLHDYGVDELHHANNVVTACQFLRSRSLMSRGTVERMGVTQTPQATDDADRRYSIWFDVFMDSVDIHGRASRANVYGPVLFVLDTKILTTNTGRLWLTKLNPTKWARKRDDERWFQGKQDLIADNFVVGNFDQMIVARHCGGELPLKSYLNRIVLDDPKRETGDGVDFYSMAVGALRLAMDDAGLDVPIERRRCTRNCVCEDYWGRDDNRLYQMFDPKP